MSWFPGEKGSLRDSWKASRLALLPAGRYPPSSRRPTLLPSSCQPTLLPRDFHLAEPNSLRVEVAARPVCCRMTLGERH